MFYNELMFLSVLRFFAVFGFGVLRMFLFCSVMHASTGLGFAFGFKNLNNASIKSKNLIKSDMKHGNDLTFCLSVNHWRRVMSHVFVGGDINFGLSFDELTYKNDKLDLKIRNNNINLEFDIKVGLGNDAFKMYVGPAICATRFTPKVQYLGTGVKNSEKNIIAPLLGLRGGIELQLQRRVSASLYYTYAFTDEKKLESNVFGMKSISSFDAEFFVFKPRISRVGLALHCII